MSPLAERRIATVGSGVMAEAMIAGLLRGQLVEPGPGHGQPSPVGAARAARAGVRHPHGRQQRRGDRRGRRHPARRSSPRCWAGSAPSCAHRLRAGQLVLSVIAGATTAALEGFLGHHRIVRSMPNTPARLGRGMTVWYATPETTEEQRAQARALLAGARSSSSRSTTRSSWRWPPRSAGPARRTSSWSWRR